MMVASLEVIQLSATDLVHGFQGASHRRAVRRTQAAREHLLTVQRLGLSWSLTIRSLTRMPPGTYHGALSAARVKHASVGRAVIERPVRKPSCPLQGYHCLQNYGLQSNVNASASRRL